MAKFETYQLADLLMLAQQQLVYALYIENYPSKMKKLNFDTINQIDQFYKNLHNLSFNESLLLVGSLLDRDKNVISFWNWKEYLSKRKNELGKIYEKFLSSKLKETRDQIIAHTDRRNKNNRFLFSRRGGMVNFNLVKELSEIIDKLIKEFDDFTRSINKDVYAPSSFETTKIEEEIEKIMELAMPKLTNNTVI